MLADVSDTEFLFRLENKYSIGPLITVREDVLIHTYMVDCTAEYGGLLACGGSPRQAAWASLRFPPLPRGRYAFRTDSGAAAIEHTPAAIPPRPSPGRDAPPGADGTPRRRNAREFRGRSANDRSARTPRRRIHHQTGDFTIRTLSSPSGR